MKRFRIKTHTGPAHVGQLAEKVSSAGLNVVCVGTEHIFTDIEAESGEVAVSTFLTKLHEKYGHFFGLRPTINSERAL